MKRSWTADQEATIRRLWDEGLSTAAIGRVMHRTKNAIVGKAHRLFLAPRPSPIKGPVRRRRVRLRLRGAALTKAMKDKAQAAAEAALVVAEAPDPESSWAVELDVRPSPATDVVIAQVAAPVQSAPPTSPCRWPMWGDGRPTHVFCCQPMAIGRLYCPEHSARAFIRTPRWGFKFMPPA